MKMSFFGRQKFATFQGKHTSVFLPPITAPKLGKILIWRMILFFGLSQMYVYVVYKVLYIYPQVYLLIYIKIYKGNELC